jgi:hypothetical protein
MKLKIRRRVAVGTGKHQAEPWRPGFEVRQAQKSFDDRAMSNAIGAEQAKMPTFEMRDMSSFRS